MSLELNLLLLCIFEKYTDEALTAIENITDFDKTDIHGFSPLMYSIRKRMFEVTKRLIEKGCNVNRQNNRMETALHLIIKAFYREPNEEDDWIKFLDLLLKNGADVNLTDNRGFSPLMWAIKDGQVEMVKRLIKAGADINIFNKRGDWCLHIAVKSSPQNINILELLLLNGAEVNVRDGKEFSPLMFAVKNYDMVEMLIKARAEVNLDNIYSETCLHRAVKSRNPNLKIIEYLLSNGADINIKGEERKTPLFGAIESDHTNKAVKTEIAMKLINHGSDVNSVDCSGKTTLMSAVEQDLENLVQFLIQKGCNVNAVDQEKGTALLFAYQLQSIKILVMLLENGADPNETLLKKLHEIQAFEDCSISTANKLTALIKYGLRTDILPYPLYRYYRQGLLSYLLKKNKYKFDDITYLFDILYLSGSCTQKQLSLLLEDQLMEKVFQSDCKKREWVLEKCSQPLTLKQISRIAVFQNRKENIISTFMKELPTTLCEYLKFPEFPIKEEK